MVNMKLIYASGTVFSDFFRDSGIWCYQIVLHSWELLFDGVVFLLLQFVYVGAVRFLDSFQVE